MQRAHSASGAGDGAAPASRPPAPSFKPSSSATGSPGVPVPAPAPDSAPSPETQDPEAQAKRLAVAVRGLISRFPEFSAATGLQAWQRNALGGLLAALAASVLIMPQATVVALMALMAIPFLMVTALRAAALWHALVRRSRTPPRPPALSDAELPTYSVLVPLFREEDVVAHLLRALSAIDYPRHKLDIVLIVESIDRATRDALAGVRLPSHMSVLTVPDGEPRTKPRALQYALQFTHGEYVVVYDAEDAPERDQLRRAAATLLASRGRLGCLQAQLNIYNSDASWLTRQFTIEYTALFDCILPTLQRFRLPVPLGGTSNHFPRAVLDAVGGWDPFNVTEDADLGMRLARAHFLVAVLPSTTWEEAPPTFAVWLGQRTRWLKGWMQTYFVHMRDPRRLLRELGPRRFFGFQVLMGGLILSALVHPWFYLYLAIGLRHGLPFDVPQSLAARSLLLIGLFNLCAGYLSAIALGAIAAGRRGRAGLAVHAGLMPLYWLAISAAAYRALAQLLTAPYYWEKTPHLVGQERAHRIPAASSAGDVARRPVKVRA